jgi:hypothetical protein
MSLKNLICGTVSLKNFTHMLRETAFRLCYTLKSIIWALGCASCLLSRHRAAIADFAQLAGLFAYLTQDKVP